MRALLGASCLWVTGAAAQTHESQQGDYTLRSSIVPSTALARSAAEQHGIEVSSNNAVLDVVVLRRGADSARPTVAAQVQASVRDLLGASRAVELRPASSAGRVSYFGVISHAPGEVLDVEIVAKPQGSAADLRLTYRERMAVR